MTEEQRQWSHESLVLGCQVILMFLALVGCIGSFMAALYISCVFGGQCG